ncbi:hypothetical protein E2C01_082194 [Portunus trituberculatus]|uniref:Uncharacterized protein n=1 Tax=Portunus trituberculatus TaxID=210409 RepID=A0A5B7J486_PORTR|nr:hypothetical protein [Portunus trituberculatus]
MSAKRTWWRDCLGNPGQHSRFNQILPLL